MLNAAQPTPNVLMHSLHTAQYTVYQTYSVYCTFSICNDCTSCTLGYHSIATATLILQSAIIVCEWHCFVLCNEANPFMPVLVQICASTNSHAHNG